MCVSWKSKRKIKYAKNSVIVFHFDELFVKTFTLSLGTIFFRNPLLYAMYRLKIMYAWVVVFPGVSGNKTAVTECVLQLF